jgi:hypothetical protein
MWAPKSMTCWALERSDVSERENVRWGFNCRLMTLLRNFHEGKQLRIDNSNWTPAPCPKPEGRASRLPHSRRQGKNEQEPGCDLLTFRAPLCQAGMIWTWGRQEFWEPKAKREFEGSCESVHREFKPIPEKSLPYPGTFFSSHEYPDVLKLREYFFSVWI